MKHFNNKYDIKGIIVTIILLLVTSIAFHFYWDQTKGFIRTLLEAKLTGFLAGSITILIFLYHYFKHKDKEVKSEPILTKKFGSFIDNALGGIAYATVITTSLTLLKGLYIQNFFNDKIYFSEFGDLDLLTIFSVVLFLLYFSIMKVVDVSLESYKIDHTEKVLDKDRIEVKLNKEIDPLDLKEFKENK